MKKILGLFVFAVMIAVSASAANPASDFSYHLSEDASYIIIKDFKNNRNTYVIPERIEDFPVLEITSTFIGFEGVKEVSFTLPEGLKKLNLNLNSWVKPIFSHIKIENLPSSLEECTIWSYSTEAINVKCSFNKLTNLKKIDAQAVSFSDKKISINKFLDYAFPGCDIEEVIFEEGCTSVRNYGDYSGTFQDCSQLTRITLPISLGIVGNYAFYGCSKLSEIIIPQNKERLEFGKQCFDYTNISLKTQARLRQLGYTGELKIN